MPQLEQLNGLPVDREELYEDNETIGEGSSSINGNGENGHLGNNRY